jgi:hypothetical protein
MWGKKRLIHNILYPRRPEFIFDFTQQPDFVTVVCGAKKAQGDDTLSFWIAHCVIIRSWK